MLLLALVGLLLPGYLAARACRVSSPWTSAFPLSALLITNVVIVFSLAGIPLRFATVLAALTAIAAVAGLIVLCNVRGPRTVVTQHETPAPRWLRIAAMTLAALVVAGVLFRSARHPLSGFDTLFRWDGLARLMLVHQHLDYYPPVSSEDFEKYVFPDGLPPLVSTVYWWLYAAWGEPAPALTSVSVALQLVSILALTYGAARTLGGASAGCFALVALSTSTLFITGIVIGQETGFTAICVAGQLCCTLAATRDNPKGNAVAAAAYAALGALARDYGPALSVAGLAVLAFNAPLRRWLPLYCGTAALLAAPWYLRSAYLTGNPFYPNDVAGLLPVNVVHFQFLKAYAQVFGLHTLTFLDWLALTFKLVGDSPLAILLGMPAMLLAWHQRGPLLVTIVVVVGVWLWSVSYTMGGIVYSLRVLTPAWVTLSLMAGVTFARCSTLTGLRGAALQTCIRFVVVLSGLFAVAHAFSYPFPGTQLLTALGATRPDPLDDWGIQKAVATELEASERPACGVLTDSLYLAVVLQRTSRFRPVMIWSPQVAFLFDFDLPPEEVRRRLRQQNIPLVSLTPLTMQLFSGVPFIGQDSSNWSPTGIGEGGPAAVYDLPPVPGNPLEPPARRR